MRPLPRWKIRLRHEGIVAARAFNEYGKLIIRVKRLMRRMQSIDRLAYPLSVYHARSTSTHFSQSSPVALSFSPPTSLPTRTPSLATIAGILSVTYTLRIACFSVSSREDSSFGHSRPSSPQPCFPPPTLGGPHGRETSLDWFHFTSLCETRCKRRGPRRYRWFRRG